MFVNALVIGKAGKVGHYLGSEWVDWSDREEQF